MTESEPSFGRTIQLYLVDGSPGGLVIASIHGWTGSVLVGTQMTFDRLLSRPEVDRTGIYVLYGPDPRDSLRMRAYIGEADSVRERITDSAKNREFWEIALVVTTSDEALTKGHVRYLEARLIQQTIAAGRVSLDNNQEPSAERRRLPESDRANMEAFLASLRIILPMLGLDLLKHQPRAATKEAVTPSAMAAGFEIRHKSGIVARAIEEDGEFVVLTGSGTLKDAGYQSNSYAELKRELIDKGVLEVTADGSNFEFKSAYAFKSPSAAAAVVLDRNSNGRTEWKAISSRQTYHDWQATKAAKNTASE